MLRFEKIVAFCSPVATLSPAPPRSRASIQDDSFPRFMKEQPQVSSIMEISPPTVEYRCLHGSIFLGQSRLMRGLIYSEQVERLPTVSVTLLRR